MRTRKYNERKLGRGRELPSFFPPLAPFSQIKRLYFSVLLTYASSLLSESLGQATDDNGALSCFIMKGWQVYSSSVKWCLMLANIDHFLMQIVGTANTTKLDLARATKEKTTTRYYEAETTWPCPARNLIYTLGNPVWAWPFFRRWNKVSTPYLRAHWTFTRTRRVCIFLKIRQQNNSKYAFHYTFKNKVGASKSH